ncbi:MAG: acetyl-CoA carboxylase biotin carboxylase subunit [Proteobacteria bacterium]|nr:acetyl-CoA carboxylase biotin carboxylase subunit [Pseudomonadota bacterium]MCP4917068.1 acetyl-CoA carboxylase biotin carboxylase subunit [Pseudomonadota bacterium]
MLDRLVPRSVSAWPGDGLLRPFGPARLRLVSRASGRYPCLVKRVLIANRGEIAVRILRACADLGLETVAVFSEVDRDAPHVRLATYARCIGPAPASESYLKGDLILEVARELGADAVHPGYGFLSENAGFAQAVIDAGLTWIGPSPHAITAMGSKTGSRQLMQAAGVPLVPGTVEAVTDEDELLRLAEDMGYPVMLKASSGGGGKGMRRVESPADLISSFRAAKSEAQSSFGDDAVYIEKFVVNPRHVEIQVLADMHGMTVHLFERDCSIQRRNQKVIEETPCPVLPDATRQEMAAVAIQAARAVDYVGAGTVEFLYGADGSFYFLEMNTRLQVEHPITEMITGIDLAQAQLRIAMGEPLWFGQDDLVIHGHAVECRVYAEDPAQNFMPAPGRIKTYREPSGPFVRVDSGVTADFEVPIHYDPMIAKLVVWGRDREDCMRRCDRALREYRVTGIRTSIGFFRAVLADPDFQAGDYTTGFITPEFLSGLESHQDDEVAAIAAAIAQYEADFAPKTAPSNGAGESAWKRAGRWKNNHRVTR